MANYEVKNIRNVALLGHQGSGKTTLMEGLLYAGGAIKEKGSIERKTTVSDYLPDEQARQMSIQTAIATFEKDGYKVNLIDLPGNDDFISEVMGVTRVIKGAILVVDASSGVQVGTVKHWKQLRRRGIPTLIYLNKMDKDGVEFDEVLHEMKEKLGKNVLAFTYPLGQRAAFNGFVDCVFMGGDIPSDVKGEVETLHAAIVEEVAKTDDALLEKFFMEEPFTPEEMKEGLRKAILSGDIVPVLVGNAQKGIGFEELISWIKEYLASPADLPVGDATDEKGNAKEVKCDKAASVSAYVFKTLIDPYYGNISIFKVNSGVLKVGDEIYSNGSTQKVSSLFSLMGKKLNPVTEISAGDIGAATHLDDILSGHSFSSPKDITIFKPVHYPSAVCYQAISVKNKANESKLGPALAKIKIEDPSVDVKYNSETRQQLLGGLSFSHLAYIVNKLKDTYKVEVETSPMKVVYRESIKAKGEAEGRYVKQSGGSGFYGVVRMRFEPSENNEFAEEVFGGAVPKNYFPAVEKGFNEAIEHGLLAGFPVIGVKGVLYDGKYHPVDSNEQAFRMAAILAFKEAYPKCRPIILEPIMTVKVYVDAVYTGAIVSDLSTRRGRIQNIDDQEGVQVIEALVPEAELLDYVTQLKTITQASGYFTREFYAYEEVPAMLKDKVIAENKIEDNGR